MVKKILSAFVRFILIIFFSALLLIGVLRNNKVQSLLAKMSSTFLSEQLGVHVWIDKVYITSYFNILLENVNIHDHRNNPMITAKKIQVKYNIFQPYLSEIPINYLKVDSAFVNLVQYQGDSVLNINMLLANKPSDAPKNSLVNNGTSDPIRLGLKYLSIHRSHFVYHMEREGPYGVAGMDYQYIDVKNIELEAKDIHIVDDSIAAQIITLQGSDKSGVELKHFEAIGSVSSTGIILNESYLITARSKANFDLAFRYDSWWDYLDFIDKVHIEAEVRSAQINMDDISYFAPAMIGMDNILRIQGHVKGPVRNMKGTNFHLSYGKHTGFNGNIQMTGLPNIYETFIKLKIKDLATSVQDIRKFKLPYGEHLDMIPSTLERLGKIRLKGRFIGFYNDFVSNSDIYTEIGLLETDIQFTNNTEEDIVYYKGGFQARNFDVGQFIDLKSDFGSINFNLNIEGKGLELSTLETKVNGQIDKLEFKDNELNTIFVDAFVKENQFKGAMQITDDLINADFIGNIDFDTLNPVFDFVTHFTDVKLARLGLLQIDSSASLTTTVRMNFTGAKLDSFKGSILIDSTDFVYKDEIFTMDSLHIISQHFADSSQNKYLQISSDFLNGNIKGQYNLKHFSESIEHTMHSYISQVEFVEESDTAFVHQNLEFQFTLANTEMLSKLFMPSLLIRDSIVLNGNWKSLKNQINLDVNSSFITWNDLSLDMPSIIITQENEKLHSEILIKEFVLKEESKGDSLRLGLDSLMFDLFVVRDSLQFAVSWNNVNRSTENIGDIEGVLKFGEEQGLAIEFDKVDLVINDSSWHAKKGGRFVLDSNNIIFDSLGFYSENQNVLFNGAISHQADKSLFVKFKNFNISVFDILTKQSGINANGFLTGEIQLIDVYNRINFLADLKLNHFNMNGEDLGRAEIRSTWNTDNSVFVNINLEKEGNKGAYKPLYLEGYYYPDRDENQIDLDLSMNNLSLNFLNPFLNEFVANLDGRATGEATVRGSLKELDVVGQIDLVRTQFRIKYLNTLYSLSGTLNLNNDLLGFNQVTIYDTVGNKAVMQGGLTHNRLRNFGVDLTVSPENFVGLNTRKGMNELFYGQAVITGELLIKGPFDNIYLDIDATSKTGTQIHIPINTTLGVDDNNFIVFVNENDTLTKEVEKQFKPQLSSFSLNMDLALTPEAKVEISLPSQLGLIEATGYGDLNMNLSRTGNFRMSGDYRVSKGLFFFQIRNILNRRFTLNEGGTISWTGDPYNGTLAMNAKYQLKTSLNSLGLDQDSSYRNRVPVDCLIGLTGPIMNPNVKFRFEFPNATEEVKQYVFTKIDTTNPSEMSQQMLSLLVLNSFSFNDASAGGNVVSGMEGASMQIVANQLGNWLSQISKDVDVGINYRPGGELTNEEVEVALSTQLFDERVTVDGNFGYQNVQDNPAANTSSIVGDINVEVKITKDGRLRLKAFNRTNTVDLMDNTSPYTQGVGIFYRKEFNTLKELFQSKKRKEKKQQEELEKAKANAVKNEDIVEDVEK